MRIFFKPPPAGKKPEGEGKSPVFSNRFCLKISGSVCPDFHLRGNLACPGAKGNKRRARNSGKPKNLSNQTGINRRIIFSRFLFDEKSGADLSGSRAQKSDGSERAPIEKPKFPSHRIIRFFQIVWAALFICPSPAVFSAVPYEKCSMENQAWTDRFITPPPPAPSDEKTEADYCADCRVEDRLFKAAKEISDEISRHGTEKDGDIPSLCFYGSMLRNKKNPSVYNCKKSTQENPTSARAGDGSRPCFNENYVTATARAFNKVTDCFGFSKKQKERFFALLNHESSFLVNAKSPTKARCFGQLTINNILDTNSAVYFRNRMSVKEQSYGRIYESAVQKCPELKNKIIPPALALVKARPASDRTKEESALSKMNRSAPFTCGVTHDPLSCLFYSAYSMKIAEWDFNESYDGIPDYMGRRDPSAREKRDFLFPVHLNEVLVVQGKFTSKDDGKRKTGDFVFWDSSELHDFYQKIKYKRKDLKIKKVPLFDKDVLEASFLYYSHNGGRDMARTHLKGFVEDLKKKIAKGSSCKRDEACSKYRTALAAGRPLSFSDLKTAFAKYAEEAELTNKDELVNFTRRIDENMGFLHNANEDLPDEIKRKFISFSGSDAKAADRFINDLKRKCPPSPFSNRN